MARTVNATIENDEQLHTFLGEMGAEFAEHQILTDPTLVLSEAWIIWATEEWSKRLPKVLSGVGLVSDEPEDYGRALSALMMGAMNRLDEMTARPRVSVVGNS